MKAVEFEAAIGKDQRINVPADIAAEVAPGQMIRVLFLMPDPSASEANEDADWRRLGIEQFLKDDPPEDAVYDQLSKG